MVVFYQPNIGMKRDKVKSGDILINTNTFKPAHCGIVVDGQMVIHATTRGILIEHIDMWNEEADMFRANPEMNAADTKKVVDVARNILGSADYGKTRAVIKSTFGSSTGGEDLYARLTKYNERLEDHQGMVKNVYCSELVILCYQMAWFQGKISERNNKLFINLDGKHAWPSTLRRYLRSNPFFKELGLFKKQPNA